MLEKRLQRSSTIEDESLIVIDANQPDHLGPDDLDCAWLEEACAVKGDRLDTVDEDTHSEPDEKESEDDVPSGLFDKKGKRKSTWGRDVDDRERPLPADRGYSPQKPLARFPSEWNFDGQSLGTSKKRKRPPGSGIYTVKQRTRSAKASSSHPNASVHSSDKLGASRFPLEIDRDGHVRGAVVLGSRQKLHSKN